MIKTENKNHYRTPDKLIIKMLSKIKDKYEVSRILEPSAGDGAILDYITKNNVFYNRVALSSIEIDKDLQSILRGKGYSLLDGDFLKYSGNEHFDLIIANFPFENGCDHLLKALEITFSGQIICLLHAETLKNPFSNKRKELLTKLDKLGAEIEYLKDSFIDSERKTSVEVALVNIIIKRNVEEDLLGGLKSSSDYIDNLNEFELLGPESINSLIKDYQIRKEAIINTIVGFYRSYNIVSDFVDLAPKSDVFETSRSNENLTARMKRDVNNSICSLKKKYWRLLFQLPEVRKKITTKRRHEFEKQIESFESYDFNLDNIQTFLINLSKLFPKTIKDAICDLFDSMTSCAFYRGEEYKGNILHFNSWKTNNAFRVNKKVIMPFYCGLSDISWRSRDFFEDLHKVATYFSLDNEPYDIVKICENSIKSGKNRKIDTKFFIISIFQKGTIHIEFKCLKMLRRFNIEACKGKGFLPDDYGYSDIKNMSKEDIEIVSSFEERKSDYEVISRMLPCIHNAGTNERIFLCG